MVIEVKYALDKKHYYLTLAIGGKSDNDFMPTANFINQKKLFNEDVLLARVTALINHAVEGYIKDNTAKVAKHGQGKSAQVQLARSYMERIRHVYGRKRSYTESVTVDLGGKGKGATVGQAH